VLLGAALFGVTPSQWTWIGAPIIIASGLVIVWREHRLHRRAPLSAAAATPT
jgi:drug/metabolite transporter (DMT)-like permease